MKIISVLICFTTILAVFSQNNSIEWGAIEQASGRMIASLTKSGKDFYSLRWSGGAFMGSYKLSNHQDFKITATGKIEVKADGSLANIEDAEVVNNQLLVFLSDKKEDKNHVYMQ